MGKFDHTFVELTALELRFSYPIINSSLSSKERHSEYRQISLMLRLQLWNQEGLQ